MSDIESPFSVLPVEPFHLLKKLAKHEVQYIVVGGYAVRCHGYMREMRDLDLFINRTEKNVEQICEALSEVGAKNNYREIYNHLILPERKLSWVGVELITTPVELDFDELYAYRCNFEYNSLKIPVVSKQHLIMLKNTAILSPKRRVKKSIDIADLKCLMENTDQKN